MDMSLDDIISASKKGGRGGNRGGGAKRGSGGPRRGGPPRSRSRSEGTKRVPFKNRSNSEGITSDVCRLLWLADFASSG